MKNHQQIADALNARMAQLSQRVERLEEDLRQPLDPDFAEQATGMESSEANEALEGASFAEMAQIRAALGRIDDGTYGVCVSCGETIAPARLEALPYAQQCIDCARGS
ncbi:TraR/DksA family transcriptional regulator [Emcibacter sp. SYSU 3D8]|uniref:TraR/DksA family transcriptional regulator n=1 Tax=Emcibacter sp. SYSU 3D8 TaxID=3133969 RepID=UPI0031FEBEA0